MMDIRKLMEDVREGRIASDVAAAQVERELRQQPFEDIDFAKVDLHRKARQGASEVIFGEGKTAQQIIGIVRAMCDAGQSDILITRLSSEKAQLVGDQLVGDSRELVGGSCKFAYNEIARVGIVGAPPAPNGNGRILVATGGTSDIPVAEEAVLTAEMMGNEVVRAYDIGVAGLHRTLAHMDDIMDASVIIAVAGMEGALPSLIGGLASCPVIAVPTSVGYGSSFGGLSALLGMLNSCASGVAVVNIDNGFGAAVHASRINHSR